MQEIWQEVKNSLKNKIPDSSFHIWIDPVTCSSQDENTFVLTCPNRFSLSWVQDNYLPLIRDGLEILCGKKLNIQLIVASAGSNENNSNNKPKADEQLPLPGLQTEVTYCRRLCPRFTFDQFVTGNSNSFAFNIAQAIAQGTSTYNNFLYLLSNTGLGKSHLAQAIAHYMLGQDKTKKLIYVTAEEFTNDMVRALKTNTIEQFKEKYRTNCHVLLLDEVHFFEGKQRTQAELGPVLDRLAESGRTIIMTSSQSPKDIPRLNNALRSRLNSGLIASILPPDYNTRTKILQKKAQNQGISLPDEVITYLADTITDDIRQLESSVISLAAQSSLLCQPITLDMAREATKYLVKKREEISLELIQKIICQYYKVTLDVLKSKSRKQAIAHPRHMAVYLSRVLTKHSLEAIGKEFNRNHATILHAVNFVQREMEKKSPLGYQVEYLAEQIKTGAHQA